MNAQFYTVHINLVMPKFTCRYFYFDKIATSIDKYTLIVKTNIIFQSSA